MLDLLLAGLQDFGLNGYILDNDMKIMLAKRVDVKHDSLLG